MNDMVELKDISKSFNDGRHKRKILDNINIKINKGDMIGIMGRSGSGKSTMLKIIGGIMKADEGDCIINNKNISKLSLNELSDFRLKNIGFIFQNYPLIYSKNVFDNICLPLLYLKEDKDLVIEKTNSWLKQLGIEQLGNKYPYILSGGEKQRVAIARALITNPDIILADEPTGSLDIDSEKGVLEIFKKLNKEEEKTIIIVTHDDDVSNICDKTYEVMNENLKLH